MNEKETPTADSLELAKRQQIMGEELGKLFHYLWNDFAWLNECWMQFSELYLTNQTRIELMNDASPIFFKIVRDAMWESIVLRICRMTDPPQSMNKDNMTLQRLPALVRDELRDEVEDLIGKVLAKTAFARDARNKQLAHTDLFLALSQGPKPLDTAKKQDAVDALDAIGKILNAIDRVYRDMYTNWKPIANLKDGMTVLHLIRMGIKTRKVELEEISAGKRSWEDFEERKPL